MPGFRAVMGGSISMGDGAAAADIMHNCPVTKKLLDGDDGVRESNESLHGRAAPRIGGGDLLALIGWILLTVRHSKCVSTNDTNFGFVFYGNRTATAQYIQPCASKEPKGNKR